MLTATAVVAGAGYHYAITRVDEKIRHYLEAHLREHYHALSVSVHSAELVEGEGIEIRGISIVQPTGDVLHAEVAHIDEMLVKCKTDWRHLLAGDIDAQRVTIRRLKLHAVKRDDGSWSVERLFPLPKFGGRSPPVTIQQGAIALFDPKRGVESALVMREINLAIIPEVLPKEALSDAPPRLQISGEVGSDQFEKLAVTGHFDPVLGKWEVAGEALGLKISSRLLKGLPLELPKQVSQLEGLRAAADFQFRVAGTLHTDEALRFVVKGKLREGRYEHGRLPYAVTGIRGNFSCDAAGWKLEELTANSGGATLRGSIEGNRYDAGCDFSLHLAAEQLMLDHRLVALLPAEGERVWEQFDPTGILNVDFRLHRRNGLYFPAAEVECLEVAFAHEKFPYRLERAAGSIQLQDRKINVALRAWAGAQAVNLRGEFEHQECLIAGKLTFATEGPILIDQKLLAALQIKPEAHRVISSLQPRGSFQVTGEIVKHGMSDDLDLHLSVGFHDCSLRYDKFPYPIDHIFGTAELHHGAWTFRQLEGRNDSGYILCDGSFRDSRDAEGGLRLHFRCLQIPLEEELRAALPPRMQTVWTDLRPVGTLDELLIDLHYDPDSAGGERPLALNVTAAKRSDNPGSSRRSLSIEPAWFPYRIDDLVGVARYVNGQVFLEQLRGHHGRTTLSCEATGDFNAHSWALNLKRFAVDRLHADSELLSVLPDSLRSVAERIQIQGPLTLQGSLTAACPHENRGRLQTSWDVTCDLEGGAAHLGVDLKHIHGGIRLIGGSSGEQFVSAGEIAIDSLIYDGLQLLDLRGPVWFDRDRLLAGAWVPAAAGNAAPRRLSAQVLGGNIQGDVQVMLSEHAPFSVQATLEHGELQQMAIQFAPHLRNISGQSYAALELHGDATGPHTLRGRGQVRLTNADIYELPVMLALLKLLSVRRPDSTAFTNSDIDFRIHGEHVYFDRINFNGDAISLKGNGEIDFQRRLNLKFYTLVGSDQIRTRFLETVLGEASKQILAIQVTGTAEKPQVKREAFPGLNESLQHLFPELTSAAAEDRPPATSALRRMLETPQRR